ncbi:unnamed protein product [Aureobasidium mustum]|uniref:CENP-V/GFA domain-containing protein n=1 Tax=Aureobasidium mustum TaxID=2773714 RepID=A0A9N8PGC5_9PEZI|nr:unnamed protein product [Aureobasidium mustum]
MADSSSSPQRATASCFCGTVQLELPVEGPDLTQIFICHCHDCRKLTASVFTTAFCVRDSSLSHLRGESSLKTYARSSTIASGNTMTNYFCEECGTLMYRRSSGFPGLSITRVGTVDDVSLHDTKLKPRVEVWCQSRVGWFAGVEGIEKSDDQAAL